jgi:glycosyltransferase involved in cell wall biosynthesis
MRKSRVSAVIVARNEAENLPACLATLGWAQEVIVVVDAASTDDTERIARRWADRVIVRPFDDFASQRNAALRLARGDWVFAIDADERATPELAAEIRRLLAGPSIPHSGFRVPIKSTILGRPFSYSGTQDDRPLRFFRRTLGRWVGEVHEKVALRGSVGDLTHALRHRTLPDIRTFLRKIDIYTSLEARRFSREKRKFRPSDVTVRPLLAFLRLYFGKRGYRDGVEGFVFCAMSAMSVAIRHWKHFELIRRGITPGLFAPNRRLDLADERGHSLQGRKPGVRSGARRVT